MVPGLKKEIRSLKAQVKKLKAENEKLQSAEPEPPGDEAQPELKRPSFFHNSAFGKSSGWKPVGLARPNADFTPEMVNAGFALFPLKNGPIVFLKEFMIGKYPVTQSQWEAIMGNNPSKYLGPNRPVDSVSWHDCQEYIKKLNEKSGLNFRLPFEAEWEFAAGGGLKDRTEWAGTSDPDNLSDYAWFSQNSEDNTQEVGQKQPNQLGLYDMSGNVWEWCEDWHGEYQTGMALVPKGPESGENKVVRGGSHASDDNFTLVAARNSVKPENAHSDLGLRLCRYADVSETGEGES